MNNNQSTQQSSQLSKQEPPQPSRIQSELLKNYPWLLLVVVGALSMAIAALAISSLVTVGQGDKLLQTNSNPDETTQFSEPKQTKSTNWLVVVFILGAGSAGAVVIYRRLKTSRMHNFSWQTVRNSWQTARSRLTRRQQRKLLLQQSKATALRVEPQPTSKSALIRDVIAVSKSPLITKDNNSSSLDESEAFVLSLEDLAVDEAQSPADIEVIEDSLDDPAASVVTILQPEDEQTIDPSTRSLAEMMDIRQHLSLSAILQDFHPKR